MQGAVVQHLLTTLVIAALGWSSETNDADQSMPCRVPVLKDDLLFRSMLPGTLPPIDVPVSPSEATALASSVMI